MAVQQRRNSKTRKAKRRTHYKLASPTLTKCPDCGEYKAPHKMCECGVYNKKTIKIVEVKEEA